MITLYTSATPNGHRAAIMLEETGLAYRSHVVDLAAGEQKTPAFLRINATGRIPAIVDDETAGEPLALAETLAIALYLCEKSGMLMPRNLSDRARAWQWAATVVSGFGAATPGIFFARQLGEAEHAKIIAKFYADIDGYLKAMDADLGGRTFLSGEEFSFADALAIPVITLSLPRFGVDLSGYASVLRWRDACQDGPSVDDPLPFAGLIPFGQVTALSPTPMKPVVGSLVSAPMNRKYWTDQDVETLRALATEGLDSSAAAVRLRRTQESVLLKAKHQGIVLAKSDKRLTARRRSALFT